VLTASEQMPEGVPSTIAAERMEEFSPGLNTDLLALLQATAELELELELEDVTISYGPVTDQPSGSGTTDAKTEGRPSSTDFGGSTVKGRVRSRGRPTRHVHLTRPVTLIGAT